MGIRIFMLALLRVFDNAFPSLAPEKRWTPLSLTLTILGWGFLIALLVGVLVASIRA
jgi:hypothetical protein